MSGASQFAGAKALVFALLTISAASVVPDEVIGENIFCTSQVVVPLNSAHTPVPMKRYLTMTTSNNTQEIVILAQVMHEACTPVLPGVTDTRELLAIKMIQARFIFHLIPCQFR